MMKALEWHSSGVLSLHSVQALSQEKATVKALLASDSMTVIKGGVILQ